MKKVITFYILIVFISIGSCFAQEVEPSLSTSNEEEEFKHELKLNALYLLLETIEVNYEYLISQKSGVGINAMYALNDDFLQYEYYITAQYRHYFGKEYANGFFIETFLMYNAFKDDEFTIQGVEVVLDEDYKSKSLAVGFGFGTKLVSKQNLLFDIGLGLGRNILSDNQYDLLVARFNISFGYRF